MQMDAVSPAFGEMTPEGERMDEGTPMGGSSAGQTAGFTQRRLDLRSPAFNPGL